MSIMLWISLFRIAFPVSHRFWIVVSSFSFVSRYLLISPWSHCWPIHCLITCLCFSVFFLWLTSSFIALWPEKILDMISNSLNLLRLVLCPNVLSILENVSCALEEKLYSALDDIFWRYQLNPSGPVCYLRLCYHSFNFPDIFLKLACGCIISYFSDDINNYYFYFLASFSLNCLFTWNFSVCVGLFLSSQRFPQMPGVLWLAVNS